jgi:hypothetical protein
MNWDLIRIGLPNGAAVLALALAPIVAIAFGPTYGKQAMRPQTTLQSQTLIANVEISRTPVVIIQPHADDAASPF